MKQRNRGGSGVNGQVFRQRARETDRDAKEEFEPGFDGTEPAPSNDSKPLGG